MITPTNSKGNWNQIKGKLKEKFTNLSEEDLTLVKGKEEETFGRLHSLLAKPQDEPKYLIDRL